MRVLLVGLAVLASVATYAQAPADPAFEVVSVKQSKDRPTAPPGAVPPDRFIRRYTLLAQLITYAHDVTGLQIEGGPDWIAQTRYDVEAKAEGRPTPEQMRNMVRRLLAERFKLKVHLEIQERPRYVLMTARPDRRLGSKLRPSAVDCPALIASRGPDYRPPTGVPQPGDPPRCIVTTRGNSCTVTLFFEGTPMWQFARTLQGQTARFVVDQTGLSGTYDIELETLRPNVPAAQCEGPSIFTAIDEQLGLKLESDRGPVDVLVIDSVERPTED